MAYLKIFENVSVEKQEKLSDKIIDLLLRTKKEDKMPFNPAKIILSRWQIGPITTENGLAALLEASFLLESEKTTEFLEKELQLFDVIEAVKDAK